MAYVQGGVIEAIDFNNLRNSVMNVYDVGNGNLGYGQVSGTDGTGTAIPTVTAAVDPVGSVEWTDLRSKIVTCAQHQGTGLGLLPPAGDLNVGDVITAHDGITDPYDFPQMATNITSNRLVAAAGSTTVFTNTTNQAIGTPWSTIAETIVDFIWPTEDDARYFFNSGGQIRWRVSRTGGSATSQNSTWSNLLTNIGTIAFQQTNTIRIGGTTGANSSIGYYDINNSTQLIFTAAVGAPPVYSANRIEIFARRLNFTGVNGGNGRRVRFTVRLTDPSSGGTDLVNGTLRVRSDERRATTFLDIRPPARVINTALNAS